jgi:Flp pilus assembly protein TadD
LERADYVVLSVPQSDYLPWTPDLVTWFNKNYLLVSSQPRTYVYNHFTRVSSGSAQALLQEGITADARGNLPLARSDFGAILSVDPANVDAYFDLGVVDQKAGLSGLAATEYQQAFFLNPRFAPALFNLAILTTPTSPSKAIALYRQILTIKPGDANTEFNLGILLVRAGQSVEGQAMLENAIHTSPSLRSSLPTGITVP